MMKRFKLYRVHNVITQWEDIGSFLRDRTAPFGWSRIRKTSVSRSQICNCSSHALCGPGFGVNELIDEATSERACSTFEAANDCACREPIGNGRLLSD